MPNWKTLSLRGTCFRMLMLADQCMCNALEEWDVKIIRVALYACKSILQHDPGHRIQNSLRRDVSYATKNMYSCTLVCTQWNLLSADRCMTVEACTHGGFPSAVRSVNADVCPLMFERLHQQCCTYVYRHRWPHWYVSCVVASLWDRLGWPVMLEKLQWTRLPHIAAKEIRQNVLAITVCIQSYAMLQTLSVQDQQAEQFSNLRLTVVLNGSLTWYLCLYSRSRLVPLRLSCRVKCRSTTEVHIGRAEMQMLSGMYEELVHWMYIHRLKPKSTS